MSPSPRSRTGTSGQALAGRTFKEIASLMLGAGTNRRGKQQFRREPDRLPSLRYGRPASFGMLGL